MRLPDAPDTPDNVAVSVIVTNSQAMTVVASLGFAATKGAVPLDDVWEILDRIVMAQVGLIPKPKVIPTRDDLNGD
jgi:hypothetical protein